MRSYRIAATVVWSLSAILLLYSALVRTDDVRTVLVDFCCRNGAADGEECVEFREESIRAFDRMLGITWCGWFAAAAVLTTAFFSCFSAQSDIEKTRRSCARGTHAVLAFVALVTTSVFVANFVFVLSVVHRQNWFSLKCTDDEGELVFFNEVDPEFVDLVSHSKAYFIWPSLLLVCVAYFLDIMVPFIRFELLRSSRAAASSKNSTARRRR